MSTVIYLANQQIQVIEGVKGKKPGQIRRYYSDIAPEGSIINGMIMDTELFIPFISQMWKEQHFSDKDVILVVGSSKFVGRTMEIPRLPERKTLEFIDREYADMGRDGDTIYSYITLGPAKPQNKGQEAPAGEKAPDDKKGKKPPEQNKNLRIYVEATEPDFINDYVEIFSQAGVKLSAIYSSECSLITFTAREAVRKYRTFVLIVADLMNFSTVLFVDGDFSYYNSTRCFHDPDTVEYAFDFARSISQLTQFMQANGIEHPLECVEIAGINPDSIDMYASAIGEMGITTPVEMFTMSSQPGREDMTIQNYLHPVSGLYDGGRMEDFLLQYRQLGKRKKGGFAAATKYVIALGILLFIMLVIVITLFVTLLGKQAELAEIKDYNESPSVLMQIADYDSFSQRNAFLRAQRDATMEVDEDIYTYPLGDTDVLAIFERCAMGYATVEYESFDAENGTIRIRASAGDVESINKYIKRLSAEDIFSNVKYTGYAFDPRGGSWDIHVTCTLAESAGRDKKKDSAKPSSAGGGEGSSDGSKGGQEPGKDPASDSEGDGKPDEGAQDEREGSENQQKDTDKGRSGNGGGL